MKRSRFVVVGLCLVAKLATGQMLRMDDALSACLGNTPTTCLAGQSVIAIDQFGNPTCAAEERSISILGGNDDQGASYTHYCPPFARICAIDPLEGKYWRAPFDMRVSDLWVKTGNIIPPGDQWTATLYVADQPTSLACTIPGGMGYSYCPVPDLTDTVCVFAGDIVYLKMNADSPPQSTTGRTAWAIKNIKYRVDEQATFCPTRTPTPTAGS